MLTNLWRLHSPRVQDGRVPESNENIKPGQYPKAIQCHPNCRDTTQPQQVWHGEFADVHQETQQPKCPEPPDYRAKGNITEAIV